MCMYGYSCLKISELLHCSLCIDTPDPAAFLSCYLPGPRSRPRTGAPGPEPEPETRPEPETDCHCPGEKVADRCPLEVMGDGGILSLPCQLASDDDMVGPRLALIPAIEAPDPDTSISCDDSDSLYCRRNAAIVLARFSRRPPSNTLTRSSRPYFLAILVAFVPMGLLPCFIMSDMAGGGMPSTATA